MARTSPTLGLGEGVQLTFGTITPKERARRQTIQTLWNYRREQGWLTTNHDGGVVLMGRCERLYYRLSSSYRKTVKEEVDGAISDAIACLDDFTRISAAAKPDGSLFEAKVQFIGVLLYDHLSILPRSVWQRQLTAPTYVRLSLNLIRESMEEEYRSLRGPVHDEKARLNVEIWSKLGNVKHLGTGCTGSAVICQGQVMDGEKVHRKAENLGIFKAASQDSNAASNPNLSMKLMRFLYKYTPLSFFAGGLLSMTEGQSSVAEAAASIVSDELRVGIKQLIADCERVDQAIETGLDKKLRSYARKKREGRAIRNAEKLLVDSLNRLIEASNKTQAEDASRSIEHFLQSDRGTYNAGQITRYINPLLEQVLDNDKAFLKDLNPVPHAWVADLRPAPGQPEEMGSFQVWKYGYEDARGVMKVDKSWRRDWWPWTKRPNMPSLFMDTIAIVHKIIDDTDGHSENILVKVEGEGKDARIVDYKDIDKGRSMSPTHARWWQIFHTNYGGTWSRLEEANKPFTPIGRYLIIHMHEQSESLRGRLGDLYQEHLPQEESVNSERLTNLIERIAYLHEHRFDTKVAIAQVTNPEDLREAYDKVIAREAEDPAGPSWLDSFNERFLETMGQFE